MDIFNIICGICSVLGLLVSLFTASRVVKISQTINCGNKDDYSDTENDISNTIVNGPFIGRDNKR